MGSNIDLSYIQEVAGGDQAMVKELITDIIDLILETEKNLQQLLQQEDFSGIANAAHRLKAPIQMVGANLFYEKVQELEAAAKSANVLDEIMPFYNSVGTLSTNCKKDLKNIVDKNMVDN